MYEHFLLMEKRIEMELKIKNEKNLFILSKQTELWRNGYACIEKRSKRMKEKQRPKGLNLAKRSWLHFDRENEDIEVSGHFRAQFSANFDLISALLHHKGYFSITNTFGGHLWSKIAILSKKKLPKMDLVHINQNQLVLFIRLFFHSILIGFVVWFLRCLGGKISFLLVTWHCQQLCHQMKFVINF